MVMRPIFNIWFFSLLTEKRSLYSQKLGLIDLKDFETSKYHVKVMSDGYVTNLRDVLCKMGQITA